MQTEKDDQPAGQNLGRELSAAVVMFHQAVADRFGLSMTEHKCLDLLYRNGAMSAGRLAEVTGLTTGAITKIVDRLEKAGFVQRERSQTDRRQVTILPIQERAQALGEVFASLSKAMAAISAHYSESERQMIYEYLNQMITVLKDETAQIQAPPGNQVRNVP